MGFESTGTTAAGRTFRPAVSARPWEDTTRRNGRRSSSTRTIRGSSPPSRSTCPRPNAASGSTAARSWIVTRSSRRAWRACLESLDRLADAAHHFDPLPRDDTGPFLSASMDLHPPSRLGDYQIVREIGRGGMGIVYEAEQVSLGRRVALKLLPFTAAIDPRQVQRFQVEVQAAAHLHHPHIVPVYAVGCESGIHYYAMQLISGQSLAAIIAGLRELRANKPGLWG